MKFLKPLLNKSTKPTSFGQKRAIQMNSSLEKAKQEREKLVKKEYLSPDPLNKVYQQKGNRFDLKINKLKSS